MADNIYSINDAHLILKTPPLNVKIGIMLLYSVIVIIGTVGNVGVCYILINLSSSNFFNSRRPLTRPSSVPNPTTTLSQCSTTGFRRSKSVAWVNWQKRKKSLAPKRDSIATKSQRFSQNDTNSEARSVPHHWSTTNFFLFTLAICDLILLTLCVPFNAVSDYILAWWPFGKFMCRAIAYTQAISVLMSAAVMLAISVDRYLAIVLPLATSGRRITLSQAKCLVSVLWLISALIPLPIPIATQLLKVIVKDYRQQSESESGVQLIAEPQFMIYDQQPITSRHFQRTSKNLLLPSRFNIDDSQEFAPLLTKNKTKEWYVLKIPKLRKNSIESWLWHKNSSTLSNVRHKFRTRHIKFNQQMNTTKRINYVKAYYFCRERWKSIKGKFHFSVVWMVVQYFFPLALIAFVYIGIVVKLSKRSIPGEPHSERDFRLRRSKTKLIKMMITVVIIFGLCWLPLNTFIVISDYNPKIFRYENIHYVWFFCHWLAMSHSCCNPFIYCWMNSRFRRGFRHLYLTFTCRAPTLNNPPPGYMGFRQTLNTTIRNSILPRKKSPTTTRPSNNDLTIPSPKNPVKYVTLALNDYTSTDLGDRLNSNDTKFDIDA